jgi:mRNA-degrading endonuclease YafQ of YafQ-DinJ toxin-antitoxin module
VREAVWDRKFDRAVNRLLRRNPHLREEIRRTIRRLREDPFQPVLGTHKLKGKLDGLWACSGGYDLRIVFVFKKSERDEDDILLIDIGAHDEVY